MLFKKKRSDPAPDNVIDKRLAEQQAQNCIRILQESGNILQETTNVDTFFSRLKLYEDQIFMLQKLSPAVKLSVSPDQLAEVYSREKQEIIYNLIVRCSDATAEKAKQMKTDKGKKTQYQKFHDSFQPYLDLMDENNIRYIQDKYQANI